MITLSTIFLLLWLFFSYKAIKSRDDHAIMVIVVIPIFSVLITALIVLIITYLP